MKTILVTGGLGFIGSHTCTELLINKYRVIIIDSLINSSFKTINKIKDIVSIVNPKYAENLKFFNIDIRDKDKLKNIFNLEEKNGNHIDAVIHFAGLKSVYESINNPIKYWDVNVGGAISLLKVIRETSCKIVIFSSSATIYSFKSKSPINESQEIGPINPYGETKLAVEKMLDSLYKSNQKKYSIACLRYFNPIGAHPTGLIGEEPKGLPNNIFPLINKVAIGKIKELQIFGNDWDSEDGTGVRDFIHVMDVAEGHVKVLGYLFRNKNSNLKINIGTGRGTTVLQLIKAFQKVNKINLKYSFAHRREGDVGVVYANNSLAKNLLKWSPKRSIDDMCRDGWKWERSNI